jgi:N,N'-diacetyllegionaminate synthase
MIDRNSKRTYLIAEIGWNFLGDLKLAKEMITSAKNSGADAVKFQVWDPKFLKDGSWNSDGRREIYQKAKLNVDKFKELFEFSKQKNIFCFTSVFTIRDLKKIVEVTDQIIKIPSHEAYNIELIDEAIKLFKQVVISAGCLKKEELKKLEKYKDNPNIIILHCVSAYPLKAENCNFSKFNYLKKIYKHIGYSGHYEGIEDAVFAIMNGAIAIEKHFTTNNELDGRDNKFALNPSKFKQLRDWANLSNLFLTDQGLDLQDCEKDIFQNYRGRWDNKNVK